MLNACSLSSGVTLFIECGASLPWSRLNTGWRHLDVVTCDGSFVLICIMAEAMSLHLFSKYLLGSYLGWVPRTRMGFTHKELDVVRIKISACLGIIGRKIMVSHGECFNAQKIFLLFI